MENKESRLIQWGGRLFFVCYVALLIYYMFFSEAYGRTVQQESYQYNIVLFKEIKRFLMYRSVLGNWAVFLNVFGNFAMFIPFGFLTPLLFYRNRSLFRTVILTFTVSLVAEVSQLLLKVGSFDVDDLFLNTLGGLAGYLIFVGVCRWRKRREEEKL